MLCQNCKKNEATTHIRRIVNGASAEYHICPECARSLGYIAMGTLGELFGSVLSDLSVSRLSSRVLQCEKCGCTFDDIVKNGTIGCADCYGLFYDKLLPSIQRLHGQTAYKGKTPKGPDETSRMQARLGRLRAQLGAAVNEQNYELAAALRDEIRELEGKRHGQSES